MLTTTSNIMFDKDILTTSWILIAIFGILLTLLIIEERRSDVCVSNKEAYKKYTHTYYLLENLNFGQWYSIKHLDLRKGLYNFAGVSMFSICRSNICFTCFLFLFFIKHCFLSICSMNNHLNKDIVVIITLYKAIINL
jgi:hypothetical protein